MRNEDKLITLEKGTEFCQTALPEGIFSQASAEMKQSLLQPSSPGWLQESDSESAYSMLIKISSPV